MHGVALLVLVLGAGNEAAMERARAERARAEAEVRELVGATESKLVSLEADLTLARIDSEALTATAKAWRQAADKVRQEKDRAAASLAGPLAGLELKDLDPQVAKVLGLAAGQGAYLTKVAVGSASQAAGLVAGDILVELDGQTIAGPTWFAGAVKKTHGDVQLRLVRSGHSLELAVKARGTPRVEALTIGAARVADRATAAEAAVAEAKEHETTVTQTLARTKESLQALKGEKPRKIGVGVRDLDQATAAALGLKETGVVVTRVDPTSVGGLAGLQTGDVVIGLAGTAVVDGKDFVTRVGKSLPNERLELEVVRQGQRLSVTLGGQETAAPVASASRGPRST